MVTSTIDGAKTIGLTTLQLAGVITGSVVVGVGVGYAAHAIISKPKGVAIPQIPQVVPAPVAVAPVAAPTVAAAPVAAQAVQAQQTATIDANELNRIINAVNAAVAAQNAP